MGGKDRSSFRRGGVKSQNLVIAALVDERLHGQTDAIYFVLRGMGMKTTELPGCRSPRIVVNSDDSPALFHALRRLGLEADGTTITLKPPSAEEQLGTLAQGGPASELVAQSADRGLTEELSKSAKSFGSKASHGRQGAPSPKMSREEQQAVFERLAWSKHAAAKHPYLQALLAARGLSAGESRGVAESVAAEPQRKTLAQMSFCGYTPPPLKDKVARGPEFNDLWLGLPSKPRAEPAQQRARCEVLTKLPNHRVHRSRSLPCVVTGPTAAGLAAQRDLAARLEKLRLDKLARQAVAARDAEASGEAGLPPSVAIGRPLAGVPEESTSGPPPGIGRNLLLGAFERRGEPVASDELPQLVAPDGSGSEVGFLGGPLGSKRGFVGWQLARVSGGSDNAPDCSK